MPRSRTSVADGPLAVTTLLAAVRSVPGVRDAEVRTAANGERTLRLQLIDEADGVAVAASVAEVLDEALGVTVDPSQSVMVGDGRPENNHVSLRGPRRRVYLERLHVVTGGLDVRVDVALSSTEARVVGTATGPAVERAVLRTVAGATLNAVDALLAGRARCGLDQAELTEIGTDKVAVAMVTLLTPGGTDRLSGSALVRGDARHAMVRAVLAALNRRFETLLPESGSGPLPTLPQIAPLAVENTAAIRIVPEQRDGDDRDDVLDGRYRDADHRDAGYLGTYDAPDVYEADTAEILDVDEPPLVEAEPLVDEPSGWRRVDAEASRSVESHTATDVRDVAAPEPASDAAEVLAAGPASDRSPVRVTAAWGGAAASGGVSAAQEDPASDGATSVAPPSGSPASSVPTGTAAGAAAGAGEPPGAHGDSRHAAAEAAARVPAGPTAAEEPPPEPAAPLADPASADQPTGGPVPATEAAPDPATGDAADDAWADDAWARLMSELPVHPADASDPAAASPAGHGATSLVDLPADDPVEPATTPASVAGLPRRASGGNRSDAGDPLLGGYFRSPRPVENYIPTGNFSNDVRPTSGPPADEPHPADRSSTRSSWRYAGDPDARRPRPGDR